MAENSCLRLYMTTINMAMGCRLHGKIRQIVASSAFGKEKVCTHRSAYFHLLSIFMKEKTLLIMGLFSLLHALLCYFNLKFTFV